MSKGSSKNSLATCGLHSLFLGFIRVSRKHNFLTRVAGATSYKRLWLRMRDSFRVRRHPSGIESVAQPTSPNGTF